MAGITDKNPSNPNFLHPNKFVFSFARAPNLQYFCQSVTVPGLSIGEAMFNTPFVDLFSPGDKPMYDLLNVTFLIDEDLKSWLEIHDWLRAMSFPESYADYKNMGKLNKFAGNQPKFPQFHDASLTLFSSANTPRFRFKFKDAFPTTLSTFVINSADSPDEILTADATFRFAYYNVEIL